MKKVQIFIPTFNRCKSLKNTVKSILKQNYENIEVIILDNCSNDGTEQEMYRIISKNKNVRYIRQEQNIGMIGNFNSIHSKIDGDYFCIQTDDDIYSNDFVSNSVDLLNFYHDANIAILNAPTRINGVVFRSQIEAWQEGFYKKESALLHIINGRHPILTNCMFRSKIGHKFIFEPILGGAADVFLLFKMMMEENSIVSKKIGGYYDLHENSYSETANGIQRLLMKCNLYLAINNYCVINGKYYVKTDLLKPKFFESIYILFSNTNFDDFIKYKSLLKPYHYLLKKILILFRIFEIKIFYNLARLIISSLRKIKKCLSQVFY